MTMEERIKKWRLILGKSAAEGAGADLSEEMQGMDDVLDALYDSDQEGNLGSSSPNVNRWLGDIRKYFPDKIVQVMQNDALDRLGLHQILTEPELLKTIEPDIHLVATLLTLKKIIPARTKDTARMVVGKLVKQIEQKLKNPMREAITGSIHRAKRNRRPTLKEIDWNKTIRLNMKHYQQDLKTIIPENLIGYGRRGQALKKVILLVDQSGSMASSVVYASILAAVMASLKSLKTHLVVFDTAVVDLTPQLADPVSVLFGTQLGGGTDICQALQFVQPMIERPADTILVLISDLFEGGNKSELLKTAASIQRSGTQFITLLALSDQGKPVYDRSIAESFAALQIPTFASSPEKFPDLMAAAIKGEDLMRQRT